MLPEPLRTMLLNCIDVTMDKPTIQEFTVVNRDILGVTYDTVVSPVTPQQEGHRTYIAKLEKLNTIFYFIRLYCDEYIANLIVKDLYTEFRKTYEGSSVEPARIRGEFLDCILVENNSLPFIGRSEIKEAVLRMLN